MTGRPTLAVLHAGLGLVNRGVERVLITLVRHLSETYDITIFGSRASSDLAVIPLATLTRDSAGYNSFYESSRFLKRVLARAHLSPMEMEKLTFSISALPYLLKGRFDAALVATGYWGVSLGRIARGLVGTPIICRSGGWMMSSLEAAQLRPDVHITDNPEVSVFLQERFPHDRICQIPNGVDLETFSPDDSQLALGIERPVVLCAGAFEPVKRMDLAIRAVAKLGKGSLILLGDGGLRPELAELGARLLGPDRFYTTSATFSEMPDYYNFCDIFTLPSERESFGLVYLEAMACGKVAVSQTDTARRQIIGDAGYLCECTDVTAYAETLDRALSEQPVVAPRAQAKRYSWKHVAERYTQEINWSLSPARKVPE